MASLQNFSVPRSTVANINTQTYKLQAQIVDDSDPQNVVVLADYTGANALSWPGCLNLLPLEKQDEIVQNLAQGILLAAAGLE